MEAVIADEDPTVTSSDTDDGNQDTAAIAERENAYYDVSIDVVAVLGATNLTVSQVLKLGRGAVVELDHMVDEPVELRVNDRLVAKGTVVVLEDRLAVKLTEIVRSGTQQGIGW